MSAQVDEILEDLAQESRAFQDQLDQRLRQLRIDRRARELLDLEARPAPTPIDVATLSEVLHRPRPPRDRITGLAPWEGSTLITAQRKVGKTTTLGNLARCLFTGEDFLDRFPVRPVEGAIGFLNYEVSAAQLARWLDELDVDRERLVTVNLRGRSNPLADPDDRASLAEALRSRQVETLIVDPFGRAFTGDNQNDAGQVTKFLTDLDVFARAEVGAVDLFLTNHAGWNGERSRGSTALEDWADSLWRLVRPDETDPARFFSAFGRDVEVDEDRLDFDEATRRLSLSGTGSRRQAAASDKFESLVDAVVNVVTLMPEANGSEVGRRLKTDGFPAQNGDARKALAEAVERGLLVVEEGKRGAKCYRIARPSPGLGQLPPSPDAQNDEIPGLTRGYVQPSPTYPDLAPGDVNPPSPTPYRGEGVGGLPQNTTPTNSPEQAEGTPSGGPR
ncbi:AAA family ATPase [Aestuariimicrobium sp. Y1814]|uniref:AAA family ATPase n=1 Tax=Aestuariimicrobium sp. Y1814 TaxID=3418742 RepID=UPI003DA733CF